MVLLLNFRRLLCFFFITLFFIVHNQPITRFDIVIVVVASNKCWHWCFQFTKFISTWFILCLLCFLVSLAWSYITTTNPMCCAVLFMACNRDDKRQEGEHCTRLKWTGCWLLLAIMHQQCFIQIEIVWAHSLAVEFGGVPVCVCVRMRLHNSLPLSKLIT